MHKLSRLEIDNISRLNPRTDCEVRRLLDHLYLVEQEFRTLLIFVASERSTARTINEILERHREEWCSCGACDPCKKAMAEDQEIMGDIIRPEDES